ncbi:hypothetical protein Pyrde_1072 [Pyrodictium delaneyi]|uniref:Uncharacterized protein n=1 Tax=Pyrodictium delaneyi TaxID=1273541 RepID=A0A0P0N442_9CREN|nr:hypothetical protein [Pyrodictium delaneyi]ALL01120.1 hypothetical protein Pyrde_1072 [Pyrodictium delaneyi]
MPNMKQYTERDYIDEKLLMAVDKAAEILAEHISEWSDTIDAYWLLRRHEDEVGIPVTYDIVEQAVEKVRKTLESTDHSVSQVKV